VLDQSVSEFRSKPLLIFRAAHQDLQRAIFNAPKAAFDGAVTPPNTWPHQPKQEIDMATDDDTSKPRRSRRNRPKTTATPRGSASLAAADLPSPEAPLRATIDLPPLDAPPRTLEEAIENVRTLMLQVRAVLHCLSDVLLYSDDDDAVMHAEVARSTAGWANLAAEELDLAKLKPLIEAIRHRGGGTSGEGESNNSGLYQVREPRPIYLV
jgi:hypothetical protein